MEDTIYLENGENVKGNLELNNQLLVTFLFPFSIIKFPKVINITPIIAYLSHE